MNRSDQLAEHLVFFEELGVTGVSLEADWRLRPGDDSASGQATAVAPAEPGAPPTPTPVAPGATPTGIATTNVDTVVSPELDGVDALEHVREDLGPCTRCALHSTRTTLVFGAGNPNADLMFVGEAPGRDEDLQGIPFVGRAGQLLTKIIEAIDLTRDDVYIANVIKCRPPQNRNPEPEEVATCEPFLFRQVEAIRPKVIVALGSFAARALLRRDESISRLRGRVFEYGGAKLVPTFHPAYLLRSPEKKRDVWEDMKRVRVMLREE